MLKLIKLDLIKIFRDKLFIVMAVISLAVALLNPLIIKGISFMLSNIEDVGGTIPVSAREFAFISFGVSGGCTIVVLIFLPIIIYKDYSNGVIRNKIIYGKSRTEIYLSLLITMFVVAFIVLFISSMAAFALSLAMFPYVMAGEVVVADEIAGFFLSVLFELFIVFFEISITTLFIVGLRNVALSIVAPIAGASMLSLLGSLVSSFAPDTIIEKVVRYLDVYYLAGFIRIGKYATDNLIALSITPLAFGILFSVLGWLLFKNKDIKW